MLNVYRSYLNATQKKIWCNENCIHHRNLEYAIDVRRQLATLATKANLEILSCGNNTEPLRRALLEGLSDNLAEIQRDNSYITVSFIFLFIHNFNKINFLI